MNLKHLEEVIRQCTKAAVTAIELHENGELKSIYFGAVRVEEKELTREEVLEKEKKARNPRKDALALADRLIADKAAQSE